MLLQWPWERQWVRITLANHLFLSSQILIKKLSLWTKRKLTLWKGLYSYNFSLGDFELLIGAWYLNFKFMCTYSKSWKLFSLAVISKFWMWLKFNTTFQCVYAHCLPRCASLLSIKYIQFSLDIKIWLYV